MELVVEHGHRIDHKLITLAPECCWYRDRPFRLSSVCCHVAGLSRRALSIACMLDKYRSCLSRRINVFDVVVRHLLWSIPLIRQKLSLLLFAIVQFRHRKSDLRTPDYTKGAHDINININIDRRQKALDHPQVRSRVAAIIP